ncbi:phage holin family protein [Streptomyces broussonetiae]|uniref:Phage holin family protein n=1 Tax=Streptomyces broussonetiae TaxID=2686304 RepID=A0ABV5E3B0_9ACTN
MTTQQTRFTEVSENGHRTREQPVGELVQQASRQLSELVRAEMQLARAEMAQKGRRYGKGGGMFGGAGLFGFLMLQAGVAAAIAGLAVPLPVWAAALIVTGVLGLIAAVLAMTGRQQFKKAAPPSPQQAIANVKADVAEIKGSTHR